MVPRCRLKSGGGGNASGANHEPRSSHNAHNIEPATAMSGESPSSEASNPLREFLASLAMFSGLPGVALDELAAQVEQIALAGGTPLFEQNEHSDALYLVRFGRLSAIRREVDGQVRSLGQIGPGECVGEVGMILEGPRTASVIALRDSELLRWPRAAFERLIAQRPQPMLKLAQQALQRTGNPEPRQTPMRCFALLPGQAGLSVEAVAQSLCDELRSYGEAARCVRAEDAAGQSPEWFTQLEQQSGALVYLGNEDAAWRERCVRQSDAILLLAEGGESPASRRLLPPPHDYGHVPLHLLLNQHGDPVPGSTAPWLAAFEKIEAHHHLRQPGDMARLARRLSGRAIGLVLSGGGARGFAHLGVMRALVEAGILVDYIGGCSAGAMMGAGLAAGWSHARRVEAFRRAFVLGDPLGDRTLPLVALHRGRRASQLLEQAFGELDIEDLPVPFFCVSSDLTEGRLHVHDRGKLWVALRASSSIPGLMPPVFSGGRVLVDGGVIDNLPVGEMRRRLAGGIVAVDVGGNYRLDTTVEETELPPWWQVWARWRQRRYPGLGQLLYRAGMVNSAATVERQRSQTSLLIAPDLGGIDLLAWNQFDRAIDLGYQYALRHVGGRRDALHEETPNLGL